MGQVGTKKNSICRAGDQTSCFFSLQERLPVYCTTCSLGYRLLIEGDCEDTTDVHGCERSLRYVGTLAAWEGSLRYVGTLAAWEGSVRYVGMLAAWEGSVRYVGWDGSERGVLQPATVNTPDP